MKRLLSSQEGSGAVEFAFVAPVLALVIGAVIQLGTLAQTAVIASNAAREGARYAAVSDSSAASKALAYLNGTAGNPDGRNPAHPCKHHGERCDRWFAGNRDSAGNRRRKHAGDEQYLRSQRTAERGGEHGGVAMRLPSFFRAEHGSTITEAAFLLPVLLLMMMGIMESSRVLGAWLVLTNETREAARYGVAGIRDGDANLPAKSAAMR